MVNFKIGMFSPPFKAKPDWAQGRDNVFYWLFSHTEFIVPTTATLLAFL